MAWAGAKFKEVRFIIEEGVTQVYVAVEAEGDCPLGVQGWHHKTFPASIPISAIVPSMGEDDPILWPLKAPKEE